jgi:hypothetical protein
VGGRLSDGGSDGAVEVLWLHSRLSLMKSGRSSSGPLLITGGWISLM